MSKRVFDEIGALNICNLHLDNVIRIPIARRTIIKYEFECPSLKIWEYEWYCLFG